MLRRSGLVSYSELGTRNVYRLDQAGLGELRTWLDGFWEAALDRYAQRVREDSPAMARSRIPIRRTFRCQPT